MNFTEYDFISKLAKIATDNFAIYRKTTQKMISIAQLPFFFGEEFGLDPFEVFDKFFLRSRNSFFHSGNSSIWFYILRFSVVIFLFACSLFFMLINYVFVNINKIRAHTNIFLHTKNYSTILLVLSLKIDI
jgi:hypothetical protein